MLVETLTCVQPAPSLRKSKKAAENHLQLAAAITLSTGLVCLPAHRSPRRAWLDLDPSASPDGALRSRVPSNITCLLTFCTCAQHPTPFSTARTQHFSYSTRSQAPRTNVASAPHPSTPKTYNILITYPYLINPAPRLPV